MFVPVFSWAEDEEDLSAARAERKRAMDAASELTRATNGGTAGKDAANVDAGMDVKLPGGGTLGTGGTVKAKDTPAGVVVRMHA